MMAGPLRRQLVNPSTRVLLAVLALLSTGLFIASESAAYDDATTYATDILAGRLIEPGHLLWRPLGHAVDLVSGLHSYSAILWHLQYLCLFASVLAVLAMYQLASRLYGRFAGLLAATLMAVSNGFWAYAFSGASYSLSMVFAILALHCAIPPRGMPATVASAFAAGVLGGLAASTWGIQILAAPAIWLALLLTSARGETSNREQLRNTGALAAGYLLTFLLPLLLAYMIGIHGHAAVTAGGSHGATMSLASWLASSRHGIPAQYSAARILRVLLGWPQSMISTSELGSHLRLWRLHESPFPPSPWLGVFVVFYGAVAGTIWVLVRRFARLERRERGVILACAAALGINLLFAAAWQGTDLERYFPSLPYQLLLVALGVKLLVANYPLRPVVPAVGAALAGIAVVNWYGTFAAVLGFDSYRQVWLRELRGATSAGDLVILFGQRTQLIVSPHDENLPKIDNVSLEIEQRGAGWKAAELRNIAETQRHGGRVFLADTLFGTDAGPRDGWSFREYPRPTPSELEQVFLPFKSDRVGFVVGTEKVWLGKN